MKTDLELEHHIPLRLKFSNKNLSEINFLFFFFSPHFYKFKDFNISMTNTFSFKLTY